VLRNLKAVYAMQNRWPESLPVQQRLALLLPDEPTEGRDLGLIYLRNGVPRPALRLLNEYAETCGSDEAAALDPFLRSARRMCAEMN
jgi:regulator of sirC expression with transglutaminase-like and TPR domain